MRNILKSLNYQTYLNTNTMGMEFYATGWFAVILWFLIFHWKELKDHKADYTYMPAYILLSWLFIILDLYDMIKHRKK